MGEPAQDSREPKWWCNFCEFGTDDREAYLAHSCREELEKKGKTAVGPPGDGRHCG